MRKEIKLNDLKRKQEFETYFYRDYPFVSVTVPVKVTNIYKFSRINKGFYPIMSYIVMKAINEVEEFKYRFEDDKIYLYDKIDISITDVRKDGSIFFFLAPYEEDLNKYLANYKVNRQKYLEQKELATSENFGLVWLSCTPWYKFTSLMPPVNRDYTIPQVIWDKIEEKDGEYYVNLFIFANHGFVDGFHIAKLIENFNIAQENLKY